MAAYGSNCITVDGVQYCKETKKVKIGSIELKVTDPHKLFDAAEQNQLSKFTKISLWDSYDYPPFIKELAKQNDMKPQVLIDLLAKEDLAWYSLKELEIIYDDIKRHYDRYIIETTIRSVITTIINDITKQIGGSNA